MGQSGAGRNRAVEDRQPKLEMEIVLEILPVVVGLESDEIVGEHRLHEIGVLRDRGHGAAIGPRRVQKKPDRAADLQPPHFRAQREEVIILDPEHHVRPGKAQ